MTIIANAKKQAILTPAGDSKAGVENKNHIYGLNGTTHTSPELIFRDLPIQVSVSRNQELQIWFGQDWTDWSEEDNSGTTAEFVSYTRSISPREVICFGLHIFTKSTYSSQT